MRIATTVRVTSCIVLAAVAGIGAWRVGRSPSPPEQSTVCLDLPPSRLDVEFDPSSSSVQREAPAPPGPPFYASLFVAGRTWTLPCSFGFAYPGQADKQSGDPLRCHVDSVEVAGDETRARIACWYVHDPDVRDPDPAINTYVMTPKGLYINGSTGEPLFTPNPVAKPLPRGWGMHEPRNLDGDTAEAMVRHHGAWCHIYEHQGWDTSGGTTECISSRGIVGTGYRHDAMADRCGDMP